MADRFHAFVDGAPLQADLDTASIRNPADGEVVAEVDVCGVPEVEAAVASARRAHRALQAMPAYERAAGLRRVADLVDERKEELALDITRSMGKPIKFARGEVGRALVTLRLSAEEATRIGGEVMPLDIEPRGVGYTCMIERFANGPVAAITPFNFPLNLAMHKVAPALAAGTSVVLKPPPQSPVLGLKLAEIVHQAGFPAGTLNALHATNEASERLATHPKIRHMSFTGSAKVGWYLKSACKTQKVTLELGGNAAAVVHEDADLEWALDRCVLGSVVASGQVCIKVQRVLVHAGIYDEFLERFVIATEGAAGPDPMDPASLFGPMVDEGNARRVMSWVREAVDAGATLHCGGRREGAVVYPTVLTNVARGQRCRDEEVFGPVTVLEPYVDFDEALRGVNDSPFGLQAGVFTKDVDRAFRAFRELEVGGVIVNDFPTFRIDNFPYGGVKASGFGREGVRAAIEDYTEPRVMVLRHGGA